ncbi:hypothetical protein FN846DRAFT_176253 [Sphaerosporella brunnea]|uniref:Uncharacterized protein n=1 Tax=Sphaerosporella brunnea TaxID=1250544 RepID=A0A5J5EQ92_9PEZI|nr:hypothetical protein FN846DRAFT_176253 [Sphaerosporella brunnea]
MLRELPRDLCRFTFTAHQWQLHPCRLHSSDRAGYMLSYPPVCTYFTSPQQPTAGKNIPPWRLPLFVPSLPLPHLISHLFFSSIYFILLLCSGDPPSACLFTWRRYSRCNSLACCTCSCSQHSALAQFRHRPLPLPLTSHIIPPLSAPRFTEHNKTKNPPPKHTTSAPLATSSGSEYSGLAGALSDFQ